MSEWKTTTWGELATLEYGKGLRGYKDADGPYRVYGTNGPIGWHTGFLYGHPSVIIGRKGAYRGVHYSDRPFYVIDTAFYLKPKMRVEFDIKWAYYEILTYDINGMDSGSAIPSTSRDDFYRLKVKVPPLPTQRRIAQILGRLDDKIEVNRRINRTLEAMAQALYRHHFVEFGPYQDGPFVDSELGSIPEGWGVVALPDVIEVNPRRKLSKGDVAPYLEMSNMPTQSSRALNWYDRGYKSGMRFINGDTLVARITPCLEHGKTAFVNFLEDGQIGWGSTEYIVLRSKPPLPLEYAYFLARSEDFRSYAIQRMTGTSGRQRVSASSLDFYQIAIPPATELEQFGRVASRNLEMVRQLDNENRKLAEIRDYLLPRLLSGELEVTEVAR